VSTIPGKNQIIVKLNNKQDLQLVERLITQKGTFGFYETYNYKEVVELLKGDSLLLSFFESPTTRESSAQIGCTTAPKVAEVDKYLNSNNLGQTCRFAWSNLFEDSEVCLYALRLSNGEGIKVSGVDIENFVSGRESASQANYLSFSFKKPAVELWAEITQRNIGKALAIVLDGKVIFAPVVQDEISGGNCTVTGDFTKAQVEFIAAIGANGELPVSFQVVN
jgi:preprotein translocase subunit SecD